MSEGVLPPKNKQKVPGWFSFVKMAIQQWHIVYNWTGHCDVYTYSGIMCTLLSPDVFDE